VAKTDSGGSLKKVPLKDLSVGMYVHDVGRRWFNHPWAKKSRLITSKQEIEQLREYGIDEVIVDEARGVKARDLAPSAPATVRRPPLFEEKGPIVPAPSSPGPSAERLPDPSKSRPRWKRSFHGLTRPTSPPWKPRRSS
jgi:hypothetical protein